MPDLVAAHVWRVVATWEATPPGCAFQGQPRTGEFLILSGLADGADLSDRIHSLVPAPVGADIMVQVERADYLGRGIGTVAPGEAAT